MGAGDDRGGASSRQLAVVLVPQALGHPALRRRTLPSLRQLAGPTRYATRRRLQLSMPLARKETVIRILGPLVVLLFSCATWRQTGRLVDGPCTHLGARPADLSQSDAVDDWGFTLQASSDWPAPCARDGGFEE
jgi:hypothetical protein